MFGQRSDPAVTPKVIQHQVGDYIIPVTIHIEARSNSRVSIAKKGAIIRIAQYLSEKDRHNQITAWLTWIEKQVRKKPDHYIRFKQKIYHDGQQLNVGSVAYTIHFEREAGRSSVTGHLHTRDHKIIFVVPGNASDARLAPHIETLLSRLVAAHFLPEVTRRVHELNALHFQRPLGKISLKYNHSNWGSCSSKGNINLSSRLLFAPTKVLDYVIIHELAHRVEMNHSPRFWALVAKAMPDYEVCEKWLRDQGGSMTY